MYPLHHVGKRLRPLLGQPVTYPFSDTPQETSFNSEAGLMSDYYIIYKDGTQDGVIAGVRELTGQASMLPLWTMGFWQCRERYKSPDELCGVLDKYRDLEIPLDGIVQDWQYWGMRFQLECHEVHEPALHQQNGRPGMDEIFA